MTTAGLCEGIGGFPLAAHALGYRSIWQSEIEPFCNEVLAARFPDAELVGDMREIDAGTETPDLLTAGFPCQPVSDAGKRAAQDDERWLWPEVERVIELLMPPRVLIENVRGLLRLGMDDVLAGLARLGYCAEWDLIPALSVGAPHRRHRVWIIAHREDQEPVRVFDRAPFHFDTWDDETEALPRLIPKADRRRERLEALGNSVVPQVVISTLALLDSATGHLFADIAPTLFSTGLDRKRYPRAGVLWRGHVFPSSTSVGLRHQSAKADAPLPTPLTDRRRRLARSALRRLPLRRR